MNIPQQHLQLQQSRAEIGHQPDRSPLRPVVPPFCDGLLDTVVRENSPWAGVLRRRLGLSAAAANVRRAGRTEDEAALRDAFHLTRPGADPGPAGKRLLAWRELPARSVGHWRSSFHAATEFLGVPHDGALQEAVDAAEACAAGDRPAPFAAAQVFGVAQRALAPNAGRRPLGGRGGEGELLAAALFSGGARHARGDVADGAEGAIVFAYANGAARACDLSAELGRRAQKLQDAAPKLRAKGAGGPR